MDKFVTESTWGRVLYHLSNKKLFNNTEEDPDCVIAT